jgi:hypothetical protein
VGFPIRKSPDQSLFAAPRRLSQRITSFIACACQGIHQLPLRHLIVHIANAHPKQSFERHWQKKTSFSRSVRWQRLGKANHVRRIERPNATDRHHQHPATKNPEGSPYARLRLRNPNKSSLHNVIQNRQQAQRLLQSFFLIERSAIKSTSNTKWWSRTGSNRRHPACKAGALPAELRPQFGLASSAGDDLHRQ